MSAHRASRGRVHLMKVFPSPASLTRRTDLPHAVPRSPPVVSPALPPLPCLASPSLSSPASPRPAPPRRHSHLNNFQ
ncbi:hypothetical protein E2C01_047006 [Portunus trituberculatus]|uniref:Uncharacterized protein n=1 Tax=Portunus trituberculatus TaxID=210409 RepID=A0A5B7G019_PORTR|nr:hypothetical protein [Portunus trituberculatus]